MPALGSGVVVELLGLSGEELQVPALQDEVGQRRISRVAKRLPMQARRPPPKPHRE